jgi:hypothetical protein
MVIDCLTADTISGHDPPKHALRATRPALGSIKGFTRPRPTTSAHHIQPKKE